MVRSVYGTVHLVCLFLDFDGWNSSFVHNLAEGPGAHFRENLNFLNITNAGFWHYGWLFALSQMLSLQNLKEFFW